jgi:hypothetical protein
VRDERGEERRRDGQGDEQREENTGVNPENKRMGRQKHGIAFAWLVPSEELVISHWSLAISYIDPMA